MNIVRSKAEVATRIAEIEAQLKITEDAMQAELRRPFFDRRRNTCQFLDLEKRTQSAALKELKWIIYE
ncbi:MAG: hypothetical protein J0H74_12935 [Chitinophagaceae bacterium]|nr:hypothetical protein [Chitinophagaceae bacterium]